MPEKSSPLFPDSQLLRITSVGHDGRGLGFLQGEGKKKGIAVFVPGALPGQKIQFRIAKRAKKYLEGELLEVLEENEPLALPHCSHWRVCGGCPFQRLTYPAQLVIKRKIFADALSRIGRIPEEEFRSALAAPLPSPQLRGYRNKVEFAFGKSDTGGFALGFRHASSHLVFNIRDCFIAKPEAVKIARDFQEIARKTGLPAFEGKNGFWRFLTLREESAPWPAFIAICLTSRANNAEAEITRKAGEELLKRHPSLKAFIHEERRRADMLPIGEKRIATINSRGEKNNEAAILKRELGGKTFLLDAASFFQINGPASEILASLATEMAAKGDSLLDLYSGVGAPGLLAAKNFRSVFCIEQDKMASNWGRRNAKSFGLCNCEFLTGDSGKLLAHLPGRAPDVCLVDPPRAGLGQETLTGILRLAPEKIIYISCNPATFARDANSLWQRYKLEKLTMVDLFPHTPHLESISLWTKRPASAKIQGQ